VAPAAPGFVPFGPADLDRWALGGSRGPVDQTLIPGSQFATAHANRMEFVDLLRNRKKHRDRPKRVPAKIHISAGENDPNAAVRQIIDHANDALVEKLCFIDGHDVNAGPYLLGDLDRGRHGNCLYPCSIVRTYLVQTPVPIIEMGFEDLRLSPGDERAPHASHEFLGFPGEHYTGDDFDPAALLPAMKCWSVWTQDIAALN
jgi:hypothetical protein